MKKELQKLVERYDREEITLDELTYRLNIYDRKRFRIKSKSLIAELHPVLKSLFWKTIEKIEKETNMVFWGIYDSLENRNTKLKQYFVVFQHREYFDYKIDFNYGQIISMGSGENETFRFDDDNKIHVGIYTPSCMACYGECNADDENVLEFIVERIKHFYNELN